MMLFASLVLTTTTSALRAVAQTQIVINVTNDPRLFGWGQPWIPTHGVLGGISDALFQTTFYGLPYVGGDRLHQQLVHDQHRPALGSQTKYR
jgi:hypothetical protein